MRRRILVQEICPCVISFRTSFLSYDKLGCIRTNYKDQNALTTLALGRDLSTANNRPKFHYNDLTRLFRRPVCMTSSLTKFGWVRSCFRQVCSVSSVTSRQHLCSANRGFLVMPCHRLSSYGWRAFLWPALRYRTGYQTV